LGIGTFGKLWVVNAEQQSIVFTLECVVSQKAASNYLRSFVIAKDPTFKKVRVANFQRETVKACVELMEATGVESWATIQPHHVVRRVGPGTTKSYNEIWEHLNIEKGDLLIQKGPCSLLRLWN
jgi:hypothetical protein